MEKIILAPSVQAAFAHDRLLLERIKKRAARQRRKAQEAAETESAEIWYNEYRRQGPKRQGEQLEFKF